MANKHAITIDGETHTRTSESRVYTHAVAVKRSLGWFERQVAVYETPSRKLIGEYRAEHSRVLDNHAWLVRNGHHSPAPAATFEEYLAHEVARNLAVARKALDKALVSDFRWSVHCWNGSLKLAASKCQTLRNEGYFHAQVVEVGREYVSDDSIALVPASDAVTA